MATTFCDQHPFPVVGVCAICLRGRLLALPTSPPSPSASPSPSLSPSPALSHPISPPLPPPPRRISPFSGPLPNRTPLHRSQPLFYSTPQLNATCPQQPSRKLSLLSSIFQHRPDQKPHNSSSFLSSLVPSRFLRPAHGMSSVSTPSPPALSPPSRRAPAPTPARRCRRTGRAAVPTGFAACFGPLVRVAPHRRGHEFPGETGFSGELRKAAGPATLRRDRSLVGFGGKR